MFLNGQKVGEPVMGGIRNWTVAEVTSALKPGENLLALRLPQNFLGYRVYLTGQAPAQYPRLGEPLNAQWADLIRWQAWTRQESVRRSLEAMREIDPDRSVVCMAPDAFIGGFEQLCQDYGGHFHNTGSMAGWWNESCPMMMRAANLPCSAEPGGPARTLSEFKFFLGNWLTEGVNAIHYFIHIGDVFWNTEIRQWFEAHQPMLAALGKMHVPKADVAVLFDDDVDNLLSWPWKPGHNGYLIQYNHSTFLLRQILAWLKIKPIPGYAPEAQILSTHEVSNNGLYDVWVLFNRDREKAGKSSLVFREGCRPERCLDLQTKQEVPLVREGTEVRTPELEFGPADIHILLTPRTQICQAPLDWLELQRGWWRGTTPPRKKLPPYRAPNTLALTADWRIKPLPEDAPADQSALAAPGLDDSQWEKTDLVNWLVPEERATHRALFRRQFTLPADWQDGKIKLWIKSWIHEAVRGRLRAWLDGQPIADGNSVTAFDLTQLKPHSTHLLAVEIKSEGQVAGCIGNSWLTHLPRPENQIDLGGSWTPSRDGLAWDPPVTLPGPWNGWSMNRRRVPVPAAWSGQTVMIQLETETQCGIFGVMINGRLVRRLHHEVGTVTSLNVTPWIKFGQENEIHITRQSPGQGAIKRIALDFFP
ncbi:MAG: hypothetical protein NTW03_02790 [Verrucomicrobia bacterium]|nr:hypothetical protein [Verrucomicrobiota bacterium]